MDNGNYARLGRSCDTSARVLVSNTKFFPINDAIYTVVPTKMQMYPGEHKDFLKTVGDIEDPLHVKTARHFPKENYKYSRCCGK
jgi:hypothetical protein